ncbi:LysR substrate-binding domain-containing protein [Epibacterium sp. Ofav1-8]|uniref:LysR substrate-binding domain-containing protein n=1 Tax=Epibacterium sp. Ofav1-8 TaxID=2917735 RepID=UPI001EF6C41F|nr:LysR substrate-binding domain-containing protein [Epibacterium sp. Ofav1-8]MCG7624945.1 LysR substrate-binding domain-containing protein [Epibacterium sp. Ofav1-8]
MRLPPLNALRAFEAAARHQGFIQAAEELFVTRGAISRQVKILEDHLGVGLFHRHARGVELTTAGRRLHPVLTEAFQMMQRQVEQIASDASELRVICPPTLSIRWLLPQLETFRAAHPEIKLRLTTDFYSTKGFEAAEYDLGISLQNRPGRSASLQVLPLFEMVLSPACAPALLPDLAAKGPPALAQQRLLHESPRRSDWPTWVQHFGVAQVDATAGEVFPNLDMATRAAVIGAGVVMADLVLCAEELARGDLVLPFPEMTCGTPDGAYALVGEAEKWHDPKVVAFRDWLMAGPCAAALSALPQ